MEPVSDTQNSSNADMQELQDLYASVESNLYSPDAHIKLINKLRQLSMVEELETARSVMQSVITPSQEVWIRWIEDYQDWNKSTEELANLFSTAIKMCPTIDILEKYGQFIFELFEKRQNQHVQEMDMSITSVDQYLAEFASGVEDTQYNIDESHRAWNIYRDIMVSMLEAEKKQPNSSLSTILSRVKALYLNRLGVPHAQISSTFSDFSTFITTYYNATYESEMVSANKIYSEAIKLLNYRDSWELALKANRSLQNFADYIQWEIERPKRYFQPKLVRGLYERAIQIFQYVSEVWDDYIIFVCEQPKIFSRNSVESIIERATRSCPTEGSLWAHRIRVAESYGLDMEDIIGLKMAIDEIPAFSSENYNNYNSWKALALAWLPYLYRINSSSGNILVDQLTSDCHSSLEKASSSGRHDPYFEIETLIIDIFSRVGEVESARNVWKKVSKYQGTKSIFWLKWFEWEKSQGGDNYYTNALNTLKTALSRNNIDWPEMIIQAYLEFERLNGSAYSTQQAVISARRKSYAISKKRTDELTQQQQYQDQEERKQRKGKEKVDESEVNVADEENATGTNVATQKRVYSNIEGPSTASEKPTKQPKIADHRDREHNTVIIYNLPPETSEDDIKSFFHECGQIISVVQQSDSYSAIVEFSDQDDTNAALTRDFKFLNDTEVRVTSGYQTTLFVTNFPASVTEESLSELFKQYGQIISIRFPSLKYNTNRRFCYVQFLKSAAAKEAVLKLDKSTYFDEREILVVKISDPSSKQNRSGGHAEGRELYIKGVDFNKVGEGIVRSVFEPYGTIEKLRLPPSKRPGRLHDGYGFITFSTPEEANSALEALDGSDIGETGRAVSVSIAGKPPMKKTTEKVMKINTKQSNENPASEEVKSKSIYISNLSDTVSAAQLRTIVEEYGPLNKIVLRPDLEGAIVEYESVADAGKASLSLEGRMILDKPIRLGTSIVKPPPKPKKSTMFVPPKARAKK